MIKNKKIRIGLSIILFLSGLIFIKYDWLPRYPDPFGYLANAAGIAGYDWREQAGLIQRMYAAGYSIILVPFFLICNEYMILSKCIYVLNIIFLNIMYWILCLISDDILKECTSYMSRTMICFIICMYPAFFYNVYTITPEIFSTLLLCIIVYWVIKYENTKRIVFLYFSVGIAAYLVIVHSRNLVILLSLLMYICYLTILKYIKIKDLCKLFILFLFAVIIYFYVNSYISENLLYIQKVSEIKYVPNSFGSQVNKFQYVFSINGIKNFIENIISQSCYIQTATLGSFFWGVYYLIKRSIQIILIQGQDKKENYVVFCILGIIGMLFLSSFFFMNPTRLDQYVYGRHIESIVPIALLFAVKSIGEEKKSITTIFMIVITLILCKLTYLRLTIVSPETAIPRTIVAWDIIYDLLIENYQNILVMGMVSVIGLVLIELVRRKKRGIRYILFLFVVFMWVSTSLSALNRELKENSSKRTIYLDLMNLMNFKSKIIYSEDSSYDYLLQLLVYDEGIQVFDYEENKVDNLEGENYIVFTKEEYKGKFLNNFKQIDIKLNGKEKVYIYGEEYIRYAEELGYCFK